MCWIDHVTNEVHFKSLNFEVSALRNNRSRVKYLIILSGTTVLLLMISFVRGKIISY